MKKIAAAILAILLLASSGVVGQPSARCGDRAAIIEFLQRQYREVRVAAGVTEPDGGLVEVFASPDGASWSILVSRPGALTCVVSSGGAWQVYAPSRDV